MRSTASVLRLASLVLVSGVALFFLAEGLAQTVSTWSTPVDLGAGINTTSGEI